MPQTLITKMEQFTETDKVLAAFASDFGLKPGEWPYLVVVEGHTFVRGPYEPLVFRWVKPKIDLQHELVSQIYHCVSPKYQDYEVHLIND